MPTDVHAAGGVLWRATGTQVEIALIHRPRYDDWSLPKGHLEAGEHAAVAAVREIFEETGHPATLGAYLGRTKYPVGGRVKRVAYWAARAGDGRLRANHETDLVRWLPAVAARQTLSYPGDREILTRFAARAPDTSTLVLVRHARAEPRLDDDAARALTAQGRVQAAALVPLLAAFGATTVHAAPLRRCLQTAGPVADALGVGVREEPTLPEAVYTRDRAAGLHRLTQIRDAPATAVVVSQDGVIPDVLRAWGAGPDVRTPVATAWVVSSVVSPGGPTVVGLDRVTDLGG